MTARGRGDREASLKPPPDPPNQGRKGAREESPQPLPLPPSYLLPTRLLVKPSGGQRAQVMLSTGVSLLGEEQAEE